MSRDHGRGRRSSVSGFSVKVIKQLCSCIWASCEKYTWKPRFNLGVSKSAILVVFEIDPNDTSIPTYFGEAEKLPFDKDGRVTLPKKLINHAQIVKNVMFVGLGPTFQMWNPESYEIKKSKMIQNARDKKINPRLKPIPKGM